MNILSGAFFFKKNIFFSYDPLQKATCIKGHIKSLLEPNTENCFSTMSSDLFIINNSQSVKVAVVKTFCIC